MKEVNIENIKKVLVVMLGGIGNLILLVPTLKALRESLPGRKIVLMVAEPGVEEIINVYGLVDEVVLHDRRTNRKLFEKIQFVKYMRDMHFDMAIVSSGTNALKGSLLTYLLGVPSRVGEDVDGKGFWYTTRVHYNKDIHELEGSLRLVEAVGIKPGVPQAVLSTLPEEEVLADKFLSDKAINREDFLVGMHAGSGVQQGRFRRWPQEKFVSLGNEMIKKYGAKIVLTGGQQEVSLVNSIDQMLSHKPINIAGKMTIRQTMAIVKRCNLFISNDSGVAHIAAAVQTPLVVIFGPTNINRTSPRGKDVYIVRKDLDCSPCYDRGKVKCDTLACLTSITEADVLVGVDHLMNKGRERESD